MEADLLSVLRGHAKHSGDRVAVAAAGRSLTYQTFDEQSGLVASTLRRTGIGPAARVAILAKSCVEHFELLIGAMKANAVPVPINWRLAPLEIASILEDSQAELLVLGEEFVDKFEAIQSTLSRPPQVVSLAPHPRYQHWRDWLTDDSCEVPELLSVAGQRIVLQIYTSGTTGKPKGVMTTSASFASYLSSLSKVARFEPEAVSLSTLPLFHIGGTGWALAGMYRGATVLLLREVDPDLILEMVETERVTNLIAVPSVIQMLLGSARLPSTDVSSLRYLYYGGGPMTEPVLRQALAAFECEFIQGFGMTECALVAALQPEDHALDRDLLRSCGRPVEGTTVRLVDPETLLDVPVGAVGEMWVRSPQVFAGYWHQPEVTSATLVDGEWLRTGDAARRDADGFLFLQDRVKDMIVSGGENIYPAEVENALHNHPDISECAVIGVPSERWTETVKAIVVCGPRGRPSEAEIIAFCKRHLASYKCPTSVDFADELPRTPSGKVMKYLLRERYQQAATQLAGPSNHMTGA
ncbi:acyl-CoA synthetase [Sphingomonas oryzagri]